MSSNGGHVYQVIGDYEVVETGKNNYLIASKGDIIVDCETVDENWFRGKNIRSGVYGLIPKANIISLQQHEYCELEPELLEKLNEEGVEVSSLNSDIKEENSQDTTLDDTDEGELEEEHKRKKSHLSKFESNYVEMSSEETLNCIDEEEETTPLKTEEKVSSHKKTPIQKPPRHPSVSDTSKTTTNDEGYNSASHYSGENADTNTPLLNESKVSKQDEAGYEVPNIGVNKHQEEVGTKQRQKKKKKSLMMLWKGKNSNTESKVVEKIPADEARENYYDPPADIRDNYFLPYSSNPTIRVVLSFIAALGVSVTLFLVLLLLSKYHAVLSLSISIVVFVILFVVPVTLYHRGIICVMLLLFPSLFAHRAKIAVVILLIVFFILGPVFGIADKIHIARSCAEHGDAWFQVNASENEPTTGIQNNCMRTFKYKTDYCANNIYSRFRKMCDGWSKEKTKGEAILCNKPKSYFCLNATSLEALCSTLSPRNESSYNVPDSHLQDLKVTRTFKDVLFFLLPLLTLLLLSEAYNYNKVYLTTKNTDNIYITQRLRELDTERRNRGLTDLILPLTRIEFHTYLVRRNLSITKAERSKIVKWICFLFIAVFVTVSLVLIEDFVNKVLEATQTGQCLIFYNDHSSFRYRSAVYSLLGALFFIIIVQSHLLRLRSVVCDYIYPEMVETRSKHLYYKILHDRHAFARHVRRKIQLLSEEKRLRLRISFFSKLYDVFPDRVQWLCNIFTVRTCMICDSLSCRKTVECTELSCRAHYCFECHVDAGQNCLTCKSGVPPNTAAPRSSFCV